MSLVPANFSQVPPALTAELDLETAIALTEDAGRGLPFGRSGNSGLGHRRTSFGDSRQHLKYSLLMQLNLDLPGRLEVMGRTRFGDQNCSIARALDVLGDWWTLLIIRDAFFGMRRFKDFQKNLGIARNILTNRLNSLVDDGIFERVDVGRHGERFEYRLTPQGEALLPVLTSLREWGDDWVFGAGHEPIVLRDRKTGRRLPHLEVRDAEGGVVGRRDIRAEAGPGASTSTRRFLEGRGNGDSSRVEKLREDG